MKRKLEFTSSELASSRFALSDMTNQLQKAVTQRDTARKQVYKIQDKLEAVYSDSNHYEDEMLTKYDQLTDHIKSLETETDPVSSDGMFCFETMDDGHVYTTAVRELY